MAVRPSQAWRWETYPKNMEMRQRRKNQSVFRLSDLTQVESREFWRKQIQPRPYVEASARKRGNGRSRLPVPDSAPPRHTISSTCREEEGCMRISRTRARDRHVDFGQVVPAVSSIPLSYPTSIRLLPRIYRGRVEDGPTGAFTS